MIKLINIKINKVVLYKTRLYRTIVQCAFDKWHNASLFTKYAYYQYKHFRRKHGSSQHSLYLYFCTEIASDEYKRSSQLSGIVFDFEI